MHPQLIRSYPIHKVGPRTGLVPSKGQFRSYGDSMSRQHHGEVRRDAAVAFTMELTHVMTEIAKQEFPKKPLQTGSIVDFDDSVPLGKKHFEWHKLRYQTTAQVLNSYSWREIDMVTVDGDLEIGHVHRFANGYRITEDDRLADQHTRVALQVELGVAAREGHAQLHERIYAWGDEDLNLQGFVNHTNVPKVAAPPNQGNTSTYWVDKSQQEIVADIRLLIETAPQLTNEIEEVTHVLIPRDEYVFISTTPMSDSDPNVTILDFVKKAFPGVTFEMFHHLQQRHSLGNLSSDSIYAYDKNRTKSRLVRVEKVSQRAPFRDGLEDIYLLTSGQGGCLYKKPYSAVRMDGVGTS